MDESLQQANMDRRWEIKGASVSTPRDEFHNLNSSYIQVHVDSKVGLSYTEMADGEDTEQGLTDDPLQDSYDSDDIPDLIDDDEFELDKNETKENEKENENNNEKGSVINQNLVAQDDFIVENSKSTGGKEKADGLDYDQNMNLHIRTVTESGESENRNIRMGSQLVNKQNSPTDQHVKGQGSEQINSSVTDQGSKEGESCMLSEHIGKGHQVESISGDKYISENRQLLSPKSNEISVEENQRNNNAGKQYIESDNLQKRPYTCDVCSKGFQEAGSFKRHMLAHSEDSPYSCTICSKSYKHNFWLKKHMNEHEEPTKSYICPKRKCGKTFNSSYGLKTHLIIHKGDKPYKCDMCDKVFALKSYLTHHLQTHTKEKNHECVVCKMKFYTAYRLKQHLDTHTEMEKTIPCLICDKRFAKKVQLKQHMFCHTDEKRYKCKICGMGFTRASGRANHMMVHSEDKPHKCEYCGKGFKTATNLKIHTYIHTGERPFKCEHCNKSFRDGSNFKVHLTIHTGEKPHKCEICGRCFRQAANLATHLKSHRGEKPYKCDVCEMEYTRAHRLKIHMKEKHGVQLPPKARGKPFKENKGH